MIKISGGVGDGRVPVHMEEDSIDSTLCVSKAKSFGNTTLHHPHPSNRYPPSSLLPNLITRILLDPLHAFMLGDLLP